MINNNNTWAFGDGPFGDGYVADAGRDDDAEGGLVPGLVGARDGECGQGADRAGGGGGDLRGDVADDGAGVVVLQLGCGCRGCCGGWTAAARKAAQALAAPPARLALTTDSAREPQRSRTEWGTPIC